MMAIIAVAVFLAFLSVFIRDKKDKKRLTNAAHKGKKGGGNAIGMVLAGVGSAVLDLSEDDYSDCDDDDTADHGALVATVSGALAATISGAVVRGLKPQDSRAETLVRAPPALPAPDETLVRTPPALPPPDKRNRYNISGIRALSAMTPPRTRQSTPPRTRQGTPPRDVEYLSDEWYELYGKKAEQTKKLQDSAVDAIGRGKLMADQTSLDQDGCVAMYRSLARLPCQLAPTNLCVIYILHPTSSHVTVSRAYRTQTGPASWMRNSLRRLSRLRSLQISGLVIKHQCRVGRKMPATGEAKKRRGYLQRL